MHILQRFSLVLFLAVMGGACASYTDETRDVRLSFRSESYANALEKLDKTGLKTQERNRLLYLLERASILDRLGQREESRKLLLRADTVADELFRSSLTGDVASFLYNDSAADYQGEDYEKVAIHTLLALSFLQENDFKSATVEARRINTRLNEINSFYNDHKNRYSEDAFARYLAAMIYESRGEFDSAIIDYRAALKLYETTYNEVFETPVPDQLVIALNDLYGKRNRGDDAKQLKQKYGKIIGDKKAPAESGQVVIIHEVDTIAYKVAQDIVLPIGRAVTRISWPTIKNRSRGLYGRSGVKLDDGKFTYGEMTQNLEAIASATLEDRRTRMMLKQGGRLILKKQMADQAERNFGPLGGLAANIYGAVTETADTRSWTLLPGSYYVTRLRLPAGKHSLQIQSNGRLSAVKSVEVKPGQLVFIRDAG